MATRGNNYSTCQNILKIFDFWQFLTAFLHYKRNLRTISLLCYFPSSQLNSFEIGKRHEKHKTAWSLIQAYLNEFPTSTLRGIIFSIKLACVVKLKLTSMEWFLYNLVILIKLNKIQYINLDKALLFLRNQAICQKNWKLTSSNYHKVSYFLLKFCIRFLYNIVYKRVFRISSFCLYFVLLMKM